MMTPDRKELWRAALPWLGILAVVLVVVFFIGRAVGQQKVGIQEDGRPVEAFDYGKTEETDVELGKRLFFDPRLSSNGKVSCATCHIPDKGFSSGGLPDDLLGGKLARRAPGLLNVGGHRSYFVDGRAKTLEEQARAVLTNEHEMGNRTVEEVADRVGLPVRALVGSLVAYEKTLTRSSTRFEKFRKGENKLDLLTAEQRRGWEVFRGAGHCFRCHNGPNFTDDKFHNTGVGFVSFTDTKDIGRKKITGRDSEAGWFKTPQLWGVKDAGPYMHDASLKTLEDVVEFYDRGGIPNANLGSDMERLNLTRRQKNDLLAFLKGVL